MAKSVYSLVLSDEVIDAIDQSAYRMGLSRSNMIDRVLAEYVGMVTPERRIRQMFGEIEDLLTRSGSFQLMMQPSGSMMSLRSALNYKYNPTVRYSIERRIREEEEEIWLRIQLRTTNQTLIDYMDYFFRLWQGMEGEKGTKWSMEPARYARKLQIPKDEESLNALGETIALYIRALDGALNRFFKEISTTNIMQETVPTAAIREVEKAYKEHARQIRI